MPKGVIGNLISAFIAFIVGLIVAYVLYVLGFELVAGVITDTQTRMVLYLGLFIIMIGAVIVRPAMIVMSKE